MPHFLFWCEDTIRWYKHWFYKVNSCKWISYVPSGFLWLFNNLITSNAFYICCLPCHKEFHCSEQPQCIWQIKHYDFDMSCVKSDNGRNQFHLITLFFSCVISNLPMHVIVDKLFDLKCIYTVASLHCSFIFTELF